MLRIWCIKNIRRKNFVLCSNGNLALWFRYWMTSGSVQGMNLNSPDLPFLILDLFCVCSLLWPC